MTEQELIEKCNEPTGRFRIYWTSEIYGFGEVIRKYGFYPKRWLLNIYLAHGVSMHNRPAPHELNNSAPVMLYFSPRLVREFRKLSTKPCFCLVSPNVFYRKSNNITQDKDAKGTLAFLAHTTSQIEDRMNLESYIIQLKALPEDFQPVSVCLHYHDVNKGVYKPFYEAAFDVITVGHPLRIDFIKRFYEIVRKFKYVTSNEIGSYTFYVTEMGIPFFIYGNEPELYNHGDKNIELGKYTSYKTEQYHNVRKLFSERVPTVTLEQKVFVEEELGVYCTISRLKLARILYGSYLKHLVVKWRKRLAAKFKP